MISTSFQRRQKSKNRHIIVFSSVLQELERTVDSFVIALSANGFREIQAQTDERPDKNGFYTAVIKYGAQ